MNVTLFSVEGLSAECHTDIQRRVSERVEGSVGTMVPDRSGFGVFDETLVVNIVSAVVATAALIIQYRSGRKEDRGSSADHEAEIGGGAPELTTGEVAALERAIDNETETLQCRGLDFHLRVSKEVLEVRVTRSKGPGSSPP